MGFMHSEVLKPMGLFTNEHSVQKLDSRPARQLLRSRAAVQKTPNLMLIQDALPLQRGYQGCSIFNIDMRELVGTQICVQQTTMLNLSHCSLKNQQLSTHQQEEQPTL